MNQAGLVALAVVGLWIAYLVPHRLRFRQQLLEARTDDRFSEELRVVRVATPPGTTARRHTAAGRPYLHPRRATGGGGTMERPHATADRLGADAARRTAAEHARRAAHLARRRAAARRRAVLTAVLLVAGVAGWTAVVAAGAAVALGLVPTLALGTTLVLGRRAVLAGHRADEAWTAGARDRVVLPRGRDVSGVVGRAVHPSEAATEVLARVPRTPARERVADVTAEPEAPAPTAHVAEAPAPEVPAATDVGWAPVPVPRPTYTLKPSAPRREPAPLVLDEETPSAPAATAEPEVVEDAPAAATTGSFDLDAVLARRRAAGA